MKKILAFGCLVAALSGCQKEPIQDPLSNSLVCRTWNNGTVAAQTSYHNLTWQDTFSGSDGSACFTQLPTCLSVPIAFQKGQCLSQDPQYYSTLTNLNKCTWAVMEGYDQWNDDGSSMYSPSQITVSGGNLRLNLQYNSSANGPCAIATDRSSMNCKIQMGAVVSNASPGLNVASGRVEISAKFAAAPFTWPALWGWAGGSGSNPITEEYDMLELLPNRTNADLIPLQTFHDYYSMPDSTNGGTEVPLDPTQYHVYGVERYPDHLQYFLDGCYTRRINNGDLDDKGNKLTINDVDPMFLILNQGDGSGSVNHPELNGVEVDINRVSVYQ